MLFTLDDKVFEHSVFAESFLPAFCVTVYKYQGGVINDYCNIFDVEKMDKKKLYTALSRTTKLGYIQLSNKKLKQKYENPPFVNMETINSYFNDYYHNGQIFEIAFQNNDKIYIGSSIRNLQERLKEHMTTNSSAVFKYKNNNPTIIPIIKAPCKDKTELNNVESEYIRQYSEKYRDQLLNKHVKKESIKITYQHNAQIESEDQLRDRLRRTFGDKIKIKDDPVKKLPYYDIKIDGKRYRSVAKYKQQNKDRAMTKSTKKQQQLVGELTIGWE